MPSSLNAGTVTLGLRENWRQFSLLVLINAFVGATVGLERTVLPLLAEAEFGIIANWVVLSFLISFGVVKAIGNLFAGRLSDRYGRKPVLILGWLFGVPVPFIIMFAPSWGWVVFANALLGINQGLCWSTTVIMKVDLVGPRQRGLAMGLNESAGYLAVAAAALLTGYLAARFGMRPVPFYPGVAFVAAGLILSMFWARETRGHARHEAVTGAHARYGDQPPPTFREIFVFTSWKDRALFSASQAGLVNNLNDAMVWGLIPVLLAASGFSLNHIAVIAATYPAVWGLGQLATGALSDRWGRKWLIATGMWVQALGIAGFAMGSGFAIWLLASISMGIGTAMVYPTLLAVVSDVAHPEWRSSAIGVYRLWRDSGYAVGGLAAGVLADTLGLSFAVGAIGAVTLLSGLVVALRMYETLPADERHRQPA